MRAYGIPRIKDIAGADIVDIKRFGLKNHGGKDYLPNKSEKRRVRRVFKKKARNEFRQSKLED